MTIPGYVPPAGEVDAPSLARAIRDLHTGIPWSVTDDDIENNNTGIITINGTDSTGTTAEVKFNVNGSPFQGLIDFNELQTNVGVSTGMALRFWSKDTAQALQMGAVINPGLIVSTAGAWQGDIDFVTYKNTFGTVGFQCAMNSLNGGQFVPATDNAYIIGNSAERWKEGNFVTVNGEHALIFKTQSAGTTIDIENGSSNSAAYAGILIESDTVGTLIRSLSSGAGGGFQINANSSVFLDAQHASGKLFLRTGSSPTTRVTIDENGLVDLANGQIKFPASQNASTDANTLDDYEEGTWTPTVTFATVGDLSRTYATQTGDYVKIGRQVFFDGLVSTSSFTHTTAASFFELAGFPFTMALNIVGGGSAGMRGWTKANYTNTTLQTSTSTFMYVLATGSGQAQAELQAGDVPTGGTIFLQFNGHYRI